VRKIFAWPVFRILLVLALVLAMGIISGCTPHGRANGFGKVAHEDLLTVLPSETGVGIIAPGTSLASFFFTLVNEPGRPEPNGALVYKNLDCQVSIRSDKIFETIFFTDFSTDTDDLNLMKEKRIADRGLSISPQMEQLMSEALKNNNHFKAVGFYGTAKGTVGNEKAGAFIVLAVDNNGAGEDMLFIVLVDENGNQIYEAQGTLTCGNVRVFPRIN